MLKNIKQVFRKKSKLELTPGENVRNAIIKAEIETAKKYGYTAGNTTEKLVNIANTTGQYIDTATPYSSNFLLTFITKNSIELWKLWLVKTLRNGFIVCNLSKNLISFLRSTKSKKLEEHKKVFFLININ